MKNQVDINAEMKEWIEILERKIEGLERIHYASANVQDQIVKILEVMFSAELETNPVSYIDVGKAKRSLSRLIKSLGKQ